MSVDRPPAERRHLAIELIEHPRQRQRREVRLVEVGTTERDAVRRNRSPRYAAFVDCAEEANPCR